MRKAHIRASAHQGLRGGDKRLPVRRVRQLRRGPNGVALPVEHRAAAALEIRRDEQRRQTLDYLVESAPDHRLFRSAIDHARTRYVPALVPPEVDDFLRNERRAMESFMRDLARGAFTYAPPAFTYAPPHELSRAMDIDRRYADLGLGLVDGSVIALAEGLGIRRLAPRDVRHFAAVRLRDGSAFDLVVHPTDPERS